MVVENKNKIELLFNVVEKQMGVNQKEIKGLRKHKEVVIARNIVGCILNTELGLSFKESARAIERDRTTILYYIKVLDNNINYFKFFRENYNAISDKFWSKMSRADAEDIELQIQNLHTEIDKLTEMKNKLYLN